MKTYVSVTDTAKLIREQLHKAFPGIVFSVKSKSYSGGASITVRWTDGPTTKMVEHVTKNFEGASFDGMIDLKSYVDHDVNGEKVHYGSDYVFCEREFSRPLWVKAIETICKKYGLLAPVLKESVSTKHTSYYIDGAQCYYKQTNGTLTTYDLIMRELYETNAYKSSN